MYLNFHHIFFQVYLLQPIIVLMGESLRTQFNKNFNFFYVELPGGTILSHVVEENERFPAQFGREVIYLDIVRSSIHVRKKKREKSRQKIRRGDKC